MGNEVYVAIASTDQTGNTVTGGGGKTYAATFASITAALADATYGTRDLVTPDETQVYHLFNDITETEPVDLSGFLTTPGHKVILTAEPSVRHTGVVGTGVTLTVDKAYQVRLDLDDNVEVSWLELIFEQIGGTNVSVRNGTVYNCIGRYTHPTSNVAVFQLTAFNGTIYNCLAYNSNSRGFYRQGYQYGSIFNCVAHNCGVGYELASNGVNADVTIRNCVASDCTTDIIGDSFSRLVISNCATTSGTPLGAGSIVNLDKSLAFVDHTNLDFHINEGGPLDGQGFNITSIFSIDIDGQPWSTPVSIGFDQPGEYLLPVTISNVPLNTEVRIYNTSDNSELAGVELSSTDPVVLNVPYPGSVVNARVVFLNLQYEYLSLETSIDIPGASFPVSLRFDRNYENPL